MDSRIVRLDAPLSSWAPARPPCRPGPRARTACRRSLGGTRGLGATERGVLAPTRASRAGAKRGWRVQLRSLWRFASL